MTRYEQGFMNKCAEYGVDGSGLLKSALTPGGTIRAARIFARSPEKAKSAIRLSLEMPAQQAKDVVKAVDKAEAARSVITRILEGGKFYPGETKWLGTGLDSIGEDQARAIALKARISPDVAAALQEPFVRSVLKKGTKGVAGLKTDIRSLAKAPEFASALKKRLSEFKAMGSKEKIEQVLAAARRDAGVVDRRAGMVFSYEDLPAFERINETSPDFLYRLGKVLGAKSRNYKLGKEKGLAAMRDVLNAQRVMDY